MSDDQETQEVLALVQAFSTGSGQEEIAAATVAALDEAALKRLVTRLAKLVDLRVRIGKDQPNTGAWCEWLRSQDGFVL